MEQAEQLRSDETDLAAALLAVQGELETELTSIGRVVGRFRELDAPEAEDLARNTLRAYDAIADVIRMVRTVRGIDLADTRATPVKVAPGGEVYETSAREFFAEHGPGAGEQ